MVNDSDLYDDEPRGKKPWFMRINWRYLLLTIVIILAISASVGVRLMNPSELVRAQGQIVRIESNLMLINVNNITWQAENVIRFEIDNPVEVNVGLCFNDYLIDLCPVGTYVELVRYRNFIMEWWHQEAIIRGGS